MTSGDRAQRLQLSLLPGTAEYSPHRKQPTAMTVPLATLPLSLVTAGTTTSPMPCDLSARTATPPPLPPRLPS